MEIFEEDVDLYADDHPDEKKRKVWRDCSESKPKKIEKHPLTLFQVNLYVFKIN